MLIFEGGEIFLNDGKGTKITVAGDSIEIPVQISDLIENELAALVREDNTPPNKFKIELGHDPSVYEGKYFISFFTTDDDSGIERYEVVEGGRASVRSGSTYELLDQDLSSLIIVRAIDNAGNERVETFNPQEKTPTQKIFTTILIILIILVLLFIIYFFVLRKKR